ncbi:unnamed protein product [Polarella glacialis]|uniref:Uncharacterized protein n=1 Tax=Polarella glacialis TaxID=89957 RepID=A0A813L139_POLGL|nr:unnamed protein product [Polarella glacialis]CAE8717605.1 unnamed protein product [Polarella glacialis]
METPPVETVAACSAVQGIPLITKFSELVTPPESCCSWWRPFWLLYTVLTSTIVAALLVALLPLIVLLTLFRRAWSCYACSRYHTQPSKLKIAVIGGGWSGLQSISRLRELGVRDITGFERNDALGGTWHPKLRYHSIQVHGAMWVTSFDCYPYNAADRDANDGKVLGAEAQNYVKRFATDKGIEALYQFNTKVVAVKYDSAQRTVAPKGEVVAPKQPARLVVEDLDGNRSESGPYDLVIYASQASEPNIPDIPGQAEFEGKILHSLDFKTAQFDEIVRSKAKVVVVGGSRRPATWRSVSSAPATRRTTGSSARRTSSGSSKPGSTTAPFSTRCGASALSSACCSRSSPRPSPAGCSGAPASQ